MVCSMTPVSFSVDMFNDVEGVEQCLVFAIGYEDRSCHISEILLPLIKAGKIYVKYFVFRDYTPVGMQAEMIMTLTALGVEPVIASYGDCVIVMDEVGEFLMSLAIETNIALHIDYSSMPRTWYCGFPAVVNSHMKKNDNAFFWYSIGDYVPAKEGFPSTGLSDIRVFSGRATLRPENKRTHIFGLGFDHIRMQGIISVLDPSYYGVCYAYPALRNDILDRVKGENAELINSAALSVELQLQDFPFMVSKLADLARMLVTKGDVIFVPDGPKPLTLACSIIPHLLRQMGVLCLHVKRHEAFFEPVNISPTGEIVGFCISGDFLDEV